MMDQLEVLKETGFPTAMILPAAFAFTPAGVATGIRHACEKLQRKVVLYIKNEGYMDNADVEKLVRDGLVSVIKYAIVREDPSVDPVLEDLVQRVDPSMIMSGIGEQPAIVHLRDFRLGGFTSGCVCVAPKQSMSMLRALNGGHYDHAEHVRRVFTQLEDLRNAINPIRVLHEAVELAEIASVGPHYPNLSPVPETDRKRIWEAARMLKHLDLVARDAVPA
jgi:dihydrodipicolinate synthase/N-acetylneuraminate lyase